MLPFDFLSIAFSDMVFFLFQMTFIGPPVVRVVLLNPKGFQKLLELLKHDVLAFPQGIGQYLPSLVVYRLPKPSLV